MFSLAAAAFTIFRIFLCGILNDEKHATSTDLGMSTIRKVIRLFILFAYLGDD